ncbi:MAG: UbiD family decarboxylase [Deltaproteobacteria bacterium]|nr:UbiD family decarboxylase [Deltaproteobacteria bacterium]
MKSMRDFIEQCEQEGMLRRIKPEVDWDLELSHIAKINEERHGPALLFENVKDYDSPVITSVCTTTERLSMIMGAPMESSLVDLMRLWVEKNETKVPPKWVDSGPCKENKMMGDEVDLFKFPVPKFYPLDGGRFFGTAHFVVTQDPDTGWVNLGTYRLQLLDKNHLRHPVHPGETFGYHAQEISGHEKAHARGRGGGMRPGLVSHGRGAVVGYGQ